MLISCISLGISLGVPVSRAHAQAATHAHERSLTRCLALLQTMRGGRGISKSTWAALEGLRPDTTVLAHLDAQPEFTLQPWDYMAVMVDQERIDDGRRALTQHRAMLDSVAQQYGVDVFALVAVWGVESNFGRGTGSLSVLRSLATLSCEGRRQSYFRSELFAALRIVQDGHIPAAHFVGSWAGAFGQTQFMPTTFWSRAVDYDHDGRRDLIGNAGDAIASAANYLQHAGWQSDAPWGIEVRLPQADDAPFDARTEGRTVRRTLREWSNRGVTRADGTPLFASGQSDTTNAGLLLPATIHGPVFLVARNFNAVYRYNASTIYSLAILHLADRLRGGGPFVTPWPTTDAGLSRAERRELQTLLVARGHDVGAIDGMLSSRTVAAVRDEQVRLGWESDGRPGQRLLSELRRSRPTSR